ncbi:MAG: TonB-dependent receptor, partial [Calditrichia bacterium]
MKKISSAIIMFMLFFPALLSAGSISGKVVDQQTRQPLIGVNVLVPGTGLGASSDTSGYYLIPSVPEGKYQISFEYLGYDNVVKTDIVVKPSRPAIVNAALSQNAISGEGVTVTAGYFIEERLTQPSTVGLSREEIRRYPGGFEDVVRTVSTLPGVAINSSGGRNDLLVRGGGPSENLFVINNLEVPNINHFSTQGNSSGSLSFINLDFVDNVSFSTGGFSARYGDKMSSVLRLDMAEGRRDRLGGKLLVSATQYGLNLEGPVQDRGSFIFSARRSYLDLIFRAAGLPFVPVYSDINLLGHYELSPNDKLFILGLGAIDQVDPDQGSAENRLRNAALLDNSQNLYISGINYRHLHSRGYFDATLSANYFRYRFRQLDENRTEWFSSRADEGEYALKLQYYRALSSNVGWLSGLVLKSVSNQNTTLFADSVYNRSGNKVPFSALGVKQQLKTDSRAGKYAAFTEFEWQITDKLNSNVGLRLDYFDFIDQRAYPAPRLSLKYKLLPRHTLRLSGGIYYQSPSYVWVVNPVNRKLKALQNQMAVAGWDFLVQQDLRFSLETFYKRYRDLPGGILPGKTDYLVISNTGSGYGGREDDFLSFGYISLASLAEGRAYGAEMLLQKKFSEIPCYGQVSLSYSKSRFTAPNGEQYPGRFDQRWIFNLSGGYIFNRDWEISAKFRYFTGVPYTPVYRPSENPVNPGEIQNIPAEYLQKRLPAGHHLDVRVDRYFYFNNLTLIAFLDIQNIYNYKLPRRPSYDFWDDTISNS